MINAPLISFFFYIFEKLKICKQLPLNFWPRNGANLIEVVFLWISKLKIWSGSTNSAHGWSPTGCNSIFSWKNSHKTTNSSKVWQAAGHCCRRCCCCCCCYYCCCCYVLVRLLFVACHFLSNWNFVVFWALAFLFSFFFSYAIISSAQTLEARVRRYAIERAVEEEAAKTAAAAAEKRHSIKN